MLPSAVRAMLLQYVVGSSTIHYQFESPLIPSNCSHGTAWHQKELRPVLAPCCLLYVGIGNALAVCVMRQSSAFSGRMACEIQNSISEDNTGVCVFLPWPKDSERIIKKNLSSLLPEASMPSLITLLFNPQPRLRWKLQKRELLLTTVLDLFTLPLFTLQQYGPF